MILEATSPSPQAQTISICLSVSAGLGQEVSLGDLEEAFLQGKKIQRLPYVKQPPQGVPCLEPEQILKMEVEVYGTVRGSANWRETTRGDILALGYLQMRADACAYIHACAERLVR